MTAILLLVGFGFMAGWMLHDDWRKWRQDREFERLAAIPYPVLSAYEQAIYAFDQQLAEARRKHQPVKRIMAQKQAFVYNSLEQSCRSTATSI